MKTTLVLLLALAAGDAGQKSKAAPKPTYRKLLVTCPACDLPKGVRGAAVKGAVDCSGEQWREVAACIRKAKAAGQAFFSLQNLQGIDASIARGFVSRADGTVDRFWYDSDPSGSRAPCNAVIWKSLCRTFSLEKDEEHACTEEDRVVWCSEASHRTITLGEPQDASGLYCQPATFDYGKPGWCEGEKRKDLRQPGPDEHLVCTDGAFLTCTAHMEGLLLHSSYFEVDRKQ